MHTFKLSNHIFDYALSPVALVVYAYLCSLPSRAIRGTENHAIKVKQATIGNACCIRSPKTIRNAIAELQDNELIAKTIRTERSNRYLSTNVYIVKKLPTNGSFFFVQSTCWRIMCPRQLAVYLLLCKAHHIRLGRSWNSYNDMARQLHMKRETVISTIKELEAMQLIRKQRRHAANNHRVFVDNHYFIVQHGKCQIKKRSRFATSTSPCGTYQCPDQPYSYFTIKRENCQGAFSGRFSIRGSPQNTYQYYRPNYPFRNTTKKKNNRVVYCKYNCKLFVEKAVI